MKNTKNLCISWALEQEIATRRTTLYKASLYWCQDAATASQLVESALANAIDKQAFNLSRKCFVIRLYQLLFNAWHDHVTSLADNVEVFNPRNTGCSQRAVNFVLADELMTLPVPLSEILIFVDYAGFNSEEIADIVDAPVSTVMSRVFRARKYLREHAPEALHHSNIG